MPGRPAKPIYILHGSDQYRRRRHREEIVDALLGDADRQLALVSFDDSAELADVLDTVRTVPFLAPRRVVILDDADGFVTRYRKKLEDYLANPASNGSLILIVNTWQDRWRIAKLAVEVGEVLDCSPPSPGKLPKWLAEAARSRGKTLSKDAAGLLAAWVGPNLAQLESEVEKLALYVGKRKDIGAEDVAAVVAPTAGPVAFALSNAIDARDPKAALEALGDLLAQPGEEYRVLGLLAWHVRKSSSPRGGGYERGSPARAADPARSAEKLRRLLAADLAIKTGAEPAPTMQRLVTELCR